MVNENYQETPSESSSQTKSPAETNIPRNSSGKKIWISLIIFLVIMLIVSSYFLLFKNNSEIIIDAELLQGTSINLKQNTQVKLVMDEEKYEMTVDGVFSDFVRITIQSQPIQTNLKVGETEKFDLNGDNVYDISVTVESIGDGETNLFVRKISEQACIEEWNCTEWSACLNETEIRTCTDSNNCTTSINKPTESQNCTSPELSATCERGDLCKNDCDKGDLDCSCTGQNGTICTDDEDCSGTYIQSMGTINCCRGECVPENNASKNVS